MCRETTRGTQNGAAFWLADENGAVRKEAAEEWEGLHARADKKDMG